MASGPLILDLLILGSDVATGGAFISVIQRLRSTGSAAGLSLQTLVATVGIRCLHLASYKFGLHYSPRELPQTWFISLDCITTAAALTALLVFFLNARTYEEHKDNFGIQLFEKFQCLPTRGPCRHRGVASSLFLYAFVAVMSVVWHHVRSLAVQQSPFAKPSEYYLSFYEMLGALCLLPQLWMFHLDKRVPSVLANFVLFFALHKVLVLVFWIAYPFLTSNAPANRTIQIAFDAMSLLILADFLYYWAKSKMKGYPDVVLDDGIALVELIRTEECGLG